ncbi:MAG: hypothetical protein HZA00_09625 [Nitrospinae bacterium]|nr:hypothetical protein [Nitrospinota bacterium]
MRIKDYLDEILSKIAINPYVKSRNISFEERPPDAAYITGVITFIDNSKLHIKEFVIFKSETIILKYGYHYSNRNGDLIFRYDNAFDPKVKSLSTYPEHKHTNRGLIPAIRPMLEDILGEISELVKKNLKKL